MSEEKKWTNVPYKTWKYGKQTEMKHKVLGDYFCVWSTMLSLRSGGVNFIDGFAGIGAYHTEDDIKKGEYTSKNFGSPVLAIHKMSDFLKKCGRNNAYYLIMDKEEKNIENIRQILTEEKLLNSKIHLKTADFDKEINRALDEIEKKNIAPILCLIDPFGFSLKIKTIERIMKLKKSEIIVNFMYNSIQRWTTNPESEKVFTDLFGTDGWKKYADKHRMPLILGIGASFLALSTPEKVFERVKNYVEVGGKGGRFALYLCNLGATTPPENVKAAIEAVCKYGKHSH